MAGERERSRRGARAWRALRIVVPWLLLPGAALAGSSPLRLIDAYKVPSEPRIIDGVWRRALVPEYAARHLFELNEVPEKPRLRFSIGLGPEPVTGRVLFEAILVPKDRQRSTAYRRELDTPGWVDVEVDLGAQDLKGVTLVLRKTLMEGDRERFMTAEWGEPMLVSGVRTSAPSVVVVSIDTLRADHVGVYGDEDARTPTLDALAKGGVWYANAYSASMWTVPSHRSLLSGRFPAPSDAAPESTDGSPYWLAEIFRNGGYLTAGFTGGGYVSDRWGFATGFDSYYMYRQPKETTQHCTPERLDGHQVFERARRWLRERAAQPFFLFVHTYDAHDRCPVWPKGVGPYDQWPDPGPEGRRRVTRFYADMIAEVDELVGSLVRELETIGVAEQTIMVVTSDHGEGLWEHGSYGHGCVFKPYESVVRVPLIVRPIGKLPQPGRIDQPVAAVDVAPTLLALTNLPRPASMDGYVLPGLGLDGRPPSAPVYVSCDDKLAVRVGPYKLISDGKTVTREALYNLEDDPGELKDVLSSAGPVAAQLRAYAREYRSRAAARVTPSSGGRPQDLDEPTRERLRALGYIE